jgi:hypothetical protein
VALDDAKRLKVVNDNLHAAFKSLQVGATLPQAPAETVPMLPAPAPEAPAASEEKAKADSAPKDLREYTVIQEHSVEDLVRLHSEGKVKGDAKVNLDLGNTDSRNRKDAVKKYLRENKVETAEGDTFRCEPSKSWGTPLVLKKQEHVTTRTTVDLV